MKKLILIATLLFFFSCNNNLKEKNTEKIKLKETNLVKLDLIMKLKPFKDKLVYKHVKNGKDTFINLLDNKTNEIIEISYPNKILSKIVYNKKENKFYFLESGRLITINPNTGDIYKASDILSGNIIEVLNSKILILTNDFCKINDDLGTKLLIFNNDKKKNEICLKASITRLYVNENNLIYYSGFTNNDNESIYSFDVNTKVNNKLVSKVGKLLPIAFQSKIELYYFVFQESKRVFFKYDLLKKKETKVNTSFLNKNLTDASYHSILSGFYLNNKIYLYVAIWNKRNKQIKSSWLEFNGKINDNYKKLKFKEFSYNINILNDHLILIGNTLTNILQE